MTFWSCTMRLIPYLQFDGQCEAAFKLYETCLGGKITFMMRYAEALQSDKAQPSGWPAGWEDKIYHVTLLAGDYMLHGADLPPDLYQAPQGFSLNLELQDLAKGERIFHGLAHNGTVKMPLQETFWAQRFGVLVDRFGIPWLINVAKQP